MFRIFADQSAPAAMQHGNTASNLKPLQVFQITGNLLKGLKDLILAIYSNFKPSSVSVIASNIEETKPSINFTGSIFILLFVICHSVVQRCCTSTDLSLKHEPCKHINIPNQEVTSEIRCNDLNGPFESRNLDKASLILPQLLKCEYSSRENRR